MEPARSKHSFVKAEAQSHPSVPPYQCVSDSQTVLLGPPFKMSLSIQFSFCFAFLLRWFQVTQIDFKLAV